MRVSKIGFLVTALALTGCAHLYTAASKNPALVQLPPVSHGFGSADHINLIAVDGVSVGMALTDRDYRRIEPGTRRLAISYEGNKALLGPHFTSVPLVIHAKLEAGRKYQVICQTSDVSVKVFVRDAATGRTVSDTAESPLTLAPETGGGPPILIPIPAAHR
ncbi:MAG: hypothetical protein DMF34_12510 [Verrucomicrobia bacterium]|nr:MAG: hypothetical protein DMF34_12510 [Verrucomicrobiota bacterium]